MGPNNLVCGKGNDYFLIESILRIWRFFLKEVLDMEKSLSCKDVGQIVISSSVLKQKMKFLRRRRIMPRKYTV